MNAAEIRFYVDNACGEMAELQVEDYLNANDFVCLNETDEKLEKIMKNKNIKDKSGAFANVLWNDEGFLMDFLGDKVYEVPNDKGRLDLLESLSKVSDVSHQAWNNVLSTLEKELISA